MTTNSDDRPTGYPHLQDGATPKVLRKKVLKLIVLGGLIQIVLSAYYLSMAHSPRPHELPVGYIASAANASQVQTTIEKGGSFAAKRYADRASLVDAIKSKAIYGGVDVSGSELHLYLASAAGVSAAAAIRTAFTAVTEQQTTERVKAATANGAKVPASTARALATPPTISDVVPLPPNDHSGTSLALLIQALVIGAAVASTGLGRIGPLTRRSVRRGVGHVGVLLAYAAASAVAVLIAAKLFGVIPDGTAARTYFMFLLLSLAVTGSVAGLISLIGPVGSELGTLYFVIGIIISGATILPEFLPAFGRHLGQALPPGAGATAIRDALYFPDASIARPIAVLSAWAVVGLGAVLISNTVANDSPDDQILGHDT